MSEKIIQLNEGAIKQELKDLVRHSVEETLNNQLRACSWGIAATPSHRAASAAKEKGSGGPVRRRRENETLGETHRYCINTFF